MTSVDPSAQIGADTSLGAFCVIGENVVIGSGCTIGSHVVIHADARIGDRVRIDDHSVVGKRPMRATNSAMTGESSETACTIEDDALIGSGTVLYAGAEIGRAVLVADQASIREDVRIGERTIVGRGVCIENHCRIGRFCKLETNAYITARSELEDYVFVAPGVLTSNDNFAGRSEERFKHFRGVTVRRGGRLGVGAIVLPGREIGADSLVAGGALVTRDTEPSSVVAGTPARYFRDVPEDQLLERQNWFD